jgi:hypothetical protein
VIRSSGPSVVNLLKIELAQKWLNLGRRDRSRRYDPVGVNGTQNRLCMTKLSQSEISYFIIKTKKKYNEIIKRKIKKKLYTMGFNTKTFRGRVGHHLASIYIYF